MRTQRGLVDVMWVAWGGVTYALMVYEVAEENTSAYKLVRDYGRILKSEAVATADTAAECRQRGYDVVRLMRCG